MTRGAARLALLGMFVMGACDKGDSKDEPSAKSSAPDDAAREAAKPAAEASPEVVTDTVFRPKGGHALVMLPELREGWSMVHLRKGGISGLQVFRGTSTDFTGFISLMVFPPMDPAPTKEKMLEQFKSMMSAGTEHLAAVGTPVPFESGLGTTLAGTSPTGVSEKAWMGVVVDGNAVVGLMVRCEVSLFDSELMPMKDALLKGLKVGGAVPKLPDTKPSVKLAGVWENLEGLRLDWLTFDPRGYAHFGSPGDPSWLDFDVALALGRGLSTYKIEGSELVLEPFPPDPNRSTYRRKFARKGDAIVLDEDEEFRRIDEAPVSLAPGTWEYYDSSSTGGGYGSMGIAVDESTYVIHADGTYEYSGAFSFIHNEMDVGSPGTIDWTSSGYAAATPTKGKWKIDGHQLLLEAGGVKATRTIYASKHSDQVVYIGGLKFVKMK